MKSICLLLSGLILSSMILFTSCNNNPSSESIAVSPADSVALKIQEAIHFDKWSETKWVQWNFAGKRDFLWDRERDFVEVIWGENQFLLDLNTKDGIALINQVEVSIDTLHSKMLEQAWSFFCNDEFWLNAPAKLFADGTQRSLVKEDNTTKLKVEYTSGGVTPGDAYVWSFDENYLPTAYEMYVSVIEQPGFPSTWSGWKTLTSGALISTEHQMGNRTLTLSNIQSGETFKDFNRSNDPFKSLITH